MTQPWQGYVEERFEGDLQRWFPSGYYPEVSDVRPVEPFLATLPADAALALAQWDRLARARAIPDTFFFEEGGMYGFESIVEEYDAEQWALGHDSGGNVYLVLRTGEVGIWDHYVSEIEAHTRFPSLDAFAWAIARAGAIDAGTLDRNGPEAAELAAQPEGGIRYLVGRLADSHADEDGDE